MDDEEKQKYREVGSIARKALERGKEICDIDVPYFKVVDEIEKVMKEEGARPAFPINIAVNEVGAHYAPYPKDNKKFKRGDLVKIDVGCHIDGYIADNALTIELGANRHKKLIKAAEESLNFAIKSIRPGVSVKSIGKNVESVIKNFGYKPISNLTGHAIERYELHSGMSIPNVSRGSETIKDGMVLAIEPFATNGKGKVKNGGQSKIYKLEKKRNLKDEDIEFYNWVKERFHLLPFTPRWCKSYGDDYEKRLYRLVRFRSAIVYPILVESRSGMISQREHTMIVDSSGAEVITKV